jgi:hypothetical protein
MAPPFPCVAGKQFYKISAVDQRRCLTVPAFCNFVATHSQTGQQPGNAGGSLFVRRCRKPAAQYAGSQGARFSRLNSAILPPAYP